MNRRWVMPVFVVGVFLAMIAGALGARYIPLDVMLWVCMGACVFASVCAVVAVVLEVRVRRRRNE